MNIHKGCDLPEKFQCTGGAIPCVNVSLICNGKADCADGSDEESSMCSGMNNNIINLSKIIILQNQF